MELSHWKSLSNDDYFIYVTASDDVHSYNFHTKPEYQSLLFYNLSHSLR